MAQLKKYAPRLFPNNQPDKSSFEKRLEADIDRVVVVNCFAFCFLWFFNSCDMRSQAKQRQPHNHLYSDGYICSICLSICLSIQLICL